MKLKGTNLIPRRWAMVYIVCNRLCIDELDRRTSERGHTNSNH